MEQRIKELFKNNPNKQYLVDELVEILNLTKDKNEYKEYGDIVTKLLHDKYLDWFTYYKCPKCNFEKTYQSIWDVPDENILCEECKNEIVNEDFSIKIAYHNQIK